MLRSLRALVSEIQVIRVVGSAGEAQEASEAILRLQPDVAILDVRLAGGTALDVLKGIGAERPNAPVVIVLTNDADPRYCRACLKVGADFFFDKSLEFHKVVEVLHSLAASLEPRWVREGGPD